MITAKEAEKLYNQSIDQVDKMIKLIEPIIINAANSGQRNVFFAVGTKDINHPIKPTKLESQVMDKLYTLGYRVMFTRYGIKTSGNPYNVELKEGYHEYSYGYAIHW